MFNIFRHRPSRRYRVEHRPGGYQGWKDTTTIRRPQLMWLVTLMFFCCCGLASVSMGVGYAMRSDPAPAATPLPSLGGSIHLVN